mgnify:CR=1 FL=1
MVLLGPVNENDGGLAGQRRPAEGGGELRQPGVQFPQPGLLGLRQADPGPDEVAQVSFQPVPGRGVGDALVLPLLDRAGEPVAALIASPTTPAVYLSTSQYASYRQIVGRSGDASAPLLGGYPTGVRVDPATGLGIVDLSLRRPDAEPSAQLVLGLDQWRGRYIDLDFSHPLSTDGRWAVTGGFSKAHVEYGNGTDGDSGNSTSDSGPATTRAAEPTSGP